MLVAWLLVVLRNALADFARSHTNDGIVSGVVTGILAKDCNPQCAFFEVVCPPGQGLGNHEFQENREAAALMKVRILQKAFKLLDDGSLVFLSRRYPGVQLIGQHWLRSSHRNHSQGDGSRFTI